MHFTYISSKEWDDSQVRTKTRCFKKITSRNSFQESETPNPVSANSKHKLKKKPKNPSWIRNVTHILKSAACWEIHLLLFPSPPCSVQEGYRWQRKAPGLQLHSLLLVAASEQTWAERSPNWGTYSCGSPLQASLNRKSPLFSKQVSLPPPSSNLSCPGSLVP